MKSKIVVHGETDEPLVLFAQGRELDMHGRNIDAFAPPDRAVVFHGADQPLVVLVHHRQGDVSVIDHDRTAHRHIANEIRV